MRPSGNETSSQRSQEFYFHPDSIHKKLPPLELVKKTPSNHLDNPQGSPKENPKDRSQASPDSTTPESPEKFREVQEHPSNMFVTGESSAFSRFPGKSRRGDDLVKSSSRLSDRNGRSESSYKEPLPPKVAMHSPPAFSMVTSVPSGAGFMGQLLMPRSQTKYPSVDAYTLRSMYPEQLGNMAAAAALARYQQAMNMMSGGPPGTGLPVPSAAHFIPTIPYTVPRPPATVIPNSSSAVRHCSESPQADPRGSHPSHSPEVSPSHLPFFPMPSDKEGEPLDLLPRSLYMNKGGRKGHLCIYCGKFYSRKYGLKIHLRTHTGYKPLKCKVCLRPFGDPSNLNKHIRLHAEGDTPYRCQYCGKVLVRRRDLERHVKSRHPTETEKEGLGPSLSLEETENLQNSSGSGEGRGSDTLLLEHSAVDLKGDHHHGDSDSLAGSYMEDEEEDEEIEVVELENSDLNTGSLQLDVMG